MNREDAVLTLEQWRQWLFCPRQFHLLLVATQSQLQAWKQEPALEEQQAWPVLGVVPRPLLLAVDGIALTGEIQVVERDGKTHALCWHGKPPACGIRRSHALEGAMLTTLLGEMGFVAGPALHLYRGDGQVRCQEEELSQEARCELEAALRCAGEFVSPQPLDDDPRCGACGIVGMCLPDERGHAEGFESPRRLVSPRDDALPLHVQEQGAKVGKCGEGLVVSKAGEVLANVHLKDLSQLVLHGNVFLTPQALHMLASQGVPVVHLSIGGWFYGMTTGLDGGDVLLRRSQYRFLETPSAALELSRILVAGKIANQRGQLRRNGRAVAEVVLSAMDAMERQASMAVTPEELRGCEGRAAHLYFGSFQSMLRPRESVWKERIPDLVLTGRNRRPPLDPVNAMLSYAYAVLAKECTVAVAGCGLDPMAGILHVPRPGRPALGLDLMEEFRPVLADSAVLFALNTGMVGPDGFCQVGEACWLTPKGRKGLLQAWENRLDQLATHPVLGYRCSMRRIIRLQARLLARWIRGESRSYLPYAIR